MQAGRLDRRIRFEKAAFSQDEAGQRVRTWNPLHECWASRLPLRGNEAQVAQQLAAKAEVAWEIRWPYGYTADITPRGDVRLIDLSDHREKLDGDNVVFVPREYGIVHVSEIGRRGGLRILAAARAE